MTLDVTRVGTSEPSPAPPRRVRSQPPGRTRAVVQAVPFLILLVLAVVGPFLTTHVPTRVAGPSSAAPDATHWFGTDSSGLDVYSRVLAAARLDVVIALCITVMTTVLGIAGGLAIAVAEHRTGALGTCARLAVRAVDLLQSVPILIAGLVAASFFGRTPIVIVLALGLALVPYQLRLMRTEALRVRGESFLDSARLSGENSARIVLRRILPNAVRPVLENASAVFGMGIIFSAGLGFLGVGIPLPEPEWGSMLASGVSDALVGRWWAATFPALAIAFAVWAASSLVTAARHLLD